MQEVLYQGVDHYVGSKKTREVKSAIPFSNWI